VASARATAPARLPAPAPRPEAGPSPQSREAISRGEQAYQDGEMVDAIKYANQAIAKGGGAPATLLLGKVLRTLGDFDKARQVYRKALVMPGGEAGAQDGLRKTDLAEREARNSGR
jgi:hypothetical protein